MADQGILQTESVFVKTGRSEICLVLGSPKHFVQILQKLFAVFHNLKNFVQISIIQEPWRRKLISSKAKIYSPDCIQYIAMADTKNLVINTSNTTSSGIGINY
jgi:hypothetical protein